MIGIFSCLRFSSERWGLPDPLSSGPLPGYRGVSRFSRRDRARWVSALRAARRNGDYNAVHALLAKAGFEGFSSSLLTEAQAETEAHLVSIHIEEGIRRATETGDTVMLASAIREAEAVKVDTDLLIQALRTESDVQKQELAAVTMILSSVLHGAQMRRAHAEEEEQTRRESVELRHLKLAMESELSALQARRRSERVAAETALSAARAHAAEVERQLAARTQEADNLRQELSSVLSDRDTRVAAAESFLDSIHSSSALEPQPQEIRTAETTAADELRSEGSVVPSSTLFLDCDDLAQAAGGDNIAQFSSRDFSAWGDAPLWLKASIIIVGVEVTYLLFAVPGLLRKIAYPLTILTHALWMSLCLSLRLRGRTESSRKQDQKPRTPRPERQASLVAYPP